MVGTHKVYISKDKAPRQARLEAKTKQLHRDFVAKYPTLSFSVFPRGGRIGVAGSPLARLNVDDPDDIFIEWINETVVAHGIDKVAALAALNRDPYGSVDLDWQRG